MTVICDFDNALFDTKKFLSQLAREWSACGVSRSPFLRTYRFVRRKGLYSPGRHIRALGPGAVKRKAALLACLRRLQGGSSRFVFSDVIPCLKQWRRRGYKLILLTYGDRVFQRAKLRHSGLTPLFERVIVTSDQYKIAMVQRLAGHGNPTVMIDDNLAALRQMAKKVRGLRTIHLERYRPFRAAAKKDKIWSVSNLYQADRCLTLVRR